MVLCGILDKSINLVFGYLCVEACSDDTKVTKRLLNKSEKNRTKILAKKCNFIWCLKVAVCHRDLRRELQTMGPATQHSLFSNVVLILGAVSWKRLG